MGTKRFKEVVQLTKVVSIIFQSKEDILVYKYSPSSSHSHSRECKMDENAVWLIFVS